MTALVSRVPCTVVTGFLGSGKTTLIRHLLENAGGRRLAVLVNEFGDIGIDGEVLKGCGIESCPDENIVELANGCICCTVADDFVPALDKILARGDIDHILIETSGLALPKPLVQAFQWPGVRSRVTVDSVVAVVDGPALAEGRVAQDLEALAAQRAADPSLDHDDPVEEVFGDQVACADLIVLSKADLLDGPARAAAVARVTVRVGPRRTARRRAGPTPVGSVRPVAVADRRERPCAGSPGWRPIRHVPCPRPRMRDSRTARPGRCRWCRACRWRCRTRAAGQPTARPARPRIRPADRSGSTTHPPVAVDPGAPRNRPSGRVCASPSPRSGRR